ncbi:MAG: tRNA uridine-5-carboxymethylaminomethyl(34) synthesis GTPase MnmE [Candidatus Obscuribacterales bacterium]|nr:tRNA uridine-5-carboxymethylaminomethyl(34) synthesis GTPase MnmE [Candidatus Obscuribacterales bacterium]
MLINDETIAAISTAPGIGAISVVRISGSIAEKIVREIFSANHDFRNSADELPVLNSRVATHGYIYDPSINEIVDEVIVTIFKAPRSYTGEDLVEISCHGGPVIASQLLALITKQGARLARRGEFTERAFLNGRMDLTQAEAVLDVIQAKTTRQSRRALGALTGHLGRQIKDVRVDLMEVLTRIVAGIDFPEEIGDAPEPEVEKVVNKCLELLDHLARTARSGKFLREGVKLALVGRPNAGKSSLLNQLLKFERAIVTDIPGTTRDAIEETIDINGIPVTLVDTAGIRETQDLVEKIGIERSTRAIEDSDLVILIVDLGAGWAEQEEQIAELIGDRDFILVRNKLDLFSDQLLDTALMTTSAPVADIALSAVTGKNVDLLTAEIEKWVFKDNPLSSGPSLNVRQADLCTRAAQSLRHVQETLAAGLPQDCLATDLKIAVDALSEISGELVSEQIIGQVFATFCIGK